MADKKYIMAIDQGTTSSRAIIFDKDTNIVASAQREFNQIFRKPGYVEHNPNDIWASVNSVYSEALMSAVPVADPNYIQERIPLRGEIPNPANPPSGCYFHTRCRYCTEKCKELTPDYVEAESGHYVACNLAEELKLRGFSYEEAK